MMGSRPARVPLFPLAGAILFPRAQLPLHVFELRDGLICYENAWFDAAAVQRQIAAHLATAREHRP